MVMRKPEPKMVKANSIKKPTAKFETKQSRQVAQKAKEDKMKMKAKSRLED
jgi:hypothetical protein